MELARNRKRRRILSTHTLLVYLGSCLAGCSQSSGPSTQVQTGTTPSANLQFSDGSTYDFGSQLIESSTSHTATITNAGNADATAIQSSFYVSVFQYAGGNYPGTGGTCRTTIPSGSSCTIVIIFYPTYGSDLTENIVLNYQDPSGGNAATGTLLHGTGIFGPTASLDVTFNATGKVTTAVGSFDAHARATAIQTDSRIVVAGYAFNGVDYEFALARYNTDGSADTAFGNGGTVMTPVGSGNAFATAIVMESDGKIIVAGNAQTGSQVGLALARFNPNGGLDTTFGSDGVVIVTVGTGSTYAQGVGFEADEKILVGGYTSVSGTNSFVLLRITTSGEVDSTFGTAGVVIPVVGSDDTCLAMQIQVDGQILLAGTTADATNDFAVVRLNPDGSFDSTFGTGGKVITDLNGGSDDEAYAMIVQPNSEILVAGSSSSGGQAKQFAVVRYSAVGVPDATFGTGGKVIFPVGTGDAEVYAIDLQSNGMAVLAGYTSLGSEDDFAVARIGTSGILDPQFGTDGIATYSFGAHANQAYALSLQSNGKLLVAGDIYGASNFDFGLLRIWP